MVADIKFSQTLNFYLKAHIFGKYCQFSCSLGSHGLDWFIFKMLSAKYHISSFFSTVSSVHGILQKQKALSIAPNANIHPSAYLSEATPGEPAGEFMSPSHLATVVKTALISRDLIKCLFSASSRASSKINIKILEMIKYFTS